MGVAGLFGRLAWLRLHLRRYEILRAAEIGLAVLVRAHLHVKCPGLLEQGDELGAAVAAGVEVGVVGVDVGRDLSQHGPAMFVGQVVAGAL